MPKKSKDQRQEQACANALKFDENIVQQVVKKVITDSDILQESLCKTQSSAAADMKGESISLLLKQKLDDEEFISCIVHKISEAIMSNDTFKQIICDTVSLELKKEITDLKKEIKESEKKRQNLEIKLEAQAQYSRRNCLIIHGKSMESNEDTDKIAVDIFNKNLGVKITKEDIDRSHRLKTKNSIKPIIVKFVSYNSRNLVFQNKKKLKGCGLLITEALTAERRACIKRLAELRRKKAVLSYWTQDGNIFFTLSSNPQKKIFLDSVSIEDLNDKFVQ